MLRDGITVILMADELNAAIRVMGIRPLVVVIPVLTDHHLHTIQAHHVPQDRTAIIHVPQSVIQIRTTATARITETALIML